MKEEKEYKKEMETPLRTKIQRASWTCMLQSKTPEDHHSPSTIWPTPKSLCGGYYSLKGDGYDPQPKSLGRWTEDIDYYYSKKTKEQTPKMSEKPHKKHAGKWIIDRHAYDKPSDITDSLTMEKSDKPKESYYYSKEIIEDSYQGYDIEKQEKYLDTRWAPGLKSTKAEKEIPRGTFDSKSCEDLDGDYKVSYEIIDGKLKILS